MSVLPDNDWPPSIGRQYSRLAMIEIERDSLPDAEYVATMERDYIHGNIDNIVARKKSVEFSEIFLPTGSEEGQLKVLMDGAPGVGKTTLTRKACVDWANGELLQQYHLVVLVPLRELRYRNAKAIDDLFPADNLEGKAEVLRHVRKTSGEHVLFIFDGYDELSLEERTQQSLFLDVIRGEKLCKSSVLVTSRPYASDNLQCLKCINRHIEVLGFTEEQIKECVERNFPNVDEATELLQTLSVRSDIASLCYFPFNCAIVFSVFKHKHCLPTTVTSLYESFVHSAFLRNIKDPKIARKIASSLKDLPAPLCDQLDSLCKLAYTGLLEDKMVFTYADLEFMFGSDSGDIEHSLFGLMTAVRSFSSCSETNYQFVHLTIQEFLAALWIARKLSKEAQWKFLSENLSNKRFRMVLVFLAGLTHLEFPAEDTSKLFTGFQFGGKIGKVVEIGHFFFLAQVVFESQDLSLFSLLVDAFPKEKKSSVPILDMKYYQLSPFDCFILSHFISWSGCHWSTLDLRHCGLTPQSFDIMCQVSNQFQEQCKHVSIGAILVFDDNCLTRSLYTKILLCPKPLWLNKTLSLSIGIARWEFDQEQSTVMPLSFECGLKSVKELFISCKGSTDAPVSEVVALFPCLKTLRVDYMPSCQFGSLMLSLQNNSALKELDPSNNTLGEEGSAVLAQMISHNKTLTKLTAQPSSLQLTTIKVSLHNTPISEVYFTASKMATWAHFFQSLLHNSALKKLDISNTTLGEEGSVALAEMIFHSKTLTELIAHSASLTDAALRAPFHDLHTCMSELRLSSNKMVTSIGWSHFFQSLHHNSVLKELDISDNTLGEEGSAALAEMISHNKTLTKLTAQPSSLQCATIKVTFHNTPISEVYFTANKMATWAHFFQSLLHNSALKELNISNNTLGEEGSVALAQMISHNKTLTELIARSAGLTDAALRAPFHHSHISELCLSSNKMVTSIGWAHFLRSLHHNSTLKVLDISSNTLGEKGSAALAQVISHNKTLTKLTTVPSSLQLATLKASFHNTPISEVYFTANKMATWAHFLTSLLHNSVLKELDISRNTLGEEGSVALAEMISHNKTLTKLTAWSAGLTDAALRAPFHDSLISELCLSFNKMVTSIGWAHFFKSLHHNSVLKKLDLNNNTLGEEGSAALAQMISHNKTLTKLSLMSRWDEITITAMAEALLQNTSLEVLRVDYKYKRSLESELARLGAHEKPGWILKLHDL